MPTTTFDLRPIWRIICGMPPALKFELRPWAGSAGFGKSSGIEANGNWHTSTKNVWGGALLFLSRIDRIVKTMWKLRRWWMKSGTVASPTRDPLMRYTSEICMATVFFSCIYLHCRRLSRWHHQEHPTPSIMHLVSNRHHQNITDLRIWTRFCERKLSAIKVCSLLKCLSRLCWWSLFGFSSTWAPMTGSLAFNAVLYNPRMLLHITKSNSFLRIEHE